MFKGDGEGGRSPDSLANDSSSAHSQIAAVRGLVLPSPGLEEGGSEDSCLTPTVTTHAARLAAIRSAVRPGAGSSPGGAGGPAGAGEGALPAVRRAQLLGPSSPAAPMFSPSAANDGGSGGSVGGGGGGPGVYARHRGKAAAYRDSPSASPARLAALPRHLAGAVSAASPGGPGGVGSVVGGGRSVGMSPAKGFGGASASPGGATTASPSKRSKLFASGTHTAGSSPATKMGGGTPQSAHRRGVAGLDSTPSR